MYRSVYYDSLKLVCLGDSLDLHTCSFIDRVILSVKSSNTRLLVNGKSAWPIFFAQKNAKCNVLLFWSLEIQYGDLSDNLSLANAGPVTFELGLQLLHVTGPAGL